MDNAFLKGLEQIKAAGPELVVEAIFRLFHSIEKMDIKELVAAKRTFDLFRSITTIGEVENKCLDQINEAMITRGAMLTLDSHNGNENKISLRSAFGNKCCEERIKKCKDVWDDELD